MIRIRITAALIFILTLSWSAVTTANGRDSDGSRMQARPHSLGSSSSDKLAPPSDAVDWRYLRLKASTKVSISVSVQPTEAPCDLVVTDAMGKAIARGKTSGGSFSTSRQLDPGLYYISVSSSRSVSYTISIR